ncbi:MAG: M24 family metallopeptidase [Hyphomicrobiaceae bacterium]
MLTTHPSIMLGSYVWDQDWLPQDEFQIRRAGLQKAMDDNGWAGVLVYGDGREHASLAWLTNFIPRMRWAMALIVSDGEPKLLASMSSRDMPAMRTMTWIGDVVSGWEWRHFDAWVADQAKGGKLGTIGFGLITPLLLSQVADSISGKFELVDGDAVLTPLRHRHRPREISLIRRSSRIVAAAATRLEEAWRAGAEIETAVLAGERCAREMAAQDVRTLFSSDNGRTLSPYRGQFDSHADALVAYLAVKTAGYWSERFVTLSRRHRRIDEACRTALADMAASAHAGTTAKELHDIARRSLGNSELHPVLAASLGHRIGLSLVEGPELRADSTEALSADTAYALRVGALDGKDGGSICSTVVLAGRDASYDLLAL